MKKILIINGHPDRESFCYAIADQYMAGALAHNAEVQRLDISKLDFSPNLAFGYRQRTELELDLLAAQQLIVWAEHLVFVYPVWWGIMPALLKGFIDRVFLPGFAFKYRNNSALWDKLLSGKSARIIATSDTPSWFDILMYQGAGLRVMRKNILQFCGIAPVRATTFGPIKSSTEAKRHSWLQHTYTLGTKFK